MNEDLAVVDDLASAPRSYKRRSRRTPLQSRAREEHWATYGVAVSDVPLDVAALFGRLAPVVLDVGFGMGEATLESAMGDPDRDVLAVDVHTPGQGALLHEIASRGLTNVRVVDGDVRLMLSSMLEPGSLSEVRVFFPDPWPKRRHWKRRLVDASFLELVASRMVGGGLLHFATDIEHYADDVRHLIADSPQFALATEVPARPTTRFERRALRASRHIHDIAAIRSSV